MSQRGQRGQALVETALAAPLLVLLTLGLLQMGWLLWQRVKLQAAAQAAARAYTVWEPESEALALSKARRAAWFAMRPQPSGSSIEVAPAAARAFEADFKARHDLWLTGSLAHRLDVRLNLSPPFGLGWLWPQGLQLSAPVSILSENTRERRPRAY